MCHQGNDHIKYVLLRHNIKYSDGEFFCEGCVMGKQHRMPFAEIPNRAKEVGSLVHTDLCGPMQNKTFGDSRFMVVFDDFYVSCFRFRCICSCFTRKT